MSKKDFDLTRREFLLKSTLLSASTVTAPFALNLFAMNALAATATYSSYKALVCVFLAGGNDHNNMVIANDTNSLIGYQAARSIGGGATIALNPTSMLQLTPVTTKSDSVYGAPADRSFALHPVMTELQALFNTNKHVAIIPNVGPLVRPISDTIGTAPRDLYQANPGWRPANLFSHSDQTSQWSNTNTNVTEKNFGWGGRIADFISTSNTYSQYTSMSTSGNSLFLAGKNINQYQITANGVPVPITGFTNFGLNPNTLKEIISKQYSTGTNKFELDHADVVNRAIAAQQNLADVFTATTSMAPANDPAVKYINPNNNLSTDNSLAIQLRTVARMIAGRSLLSANRQVFFVTLGGFDTHDFQATNHANLMARLSHGINYFYNQMQGLSDGGTGNMNDKVTLFTASDFGRTFASNGDGTDHGWGAHHFVSGAAVKGGEIYGNFPMTAVTGTIRSTTTAPLKFDNPIDVRSGNFIPQYSVDQYAATLAQWFGVDPVADIPTIFPNLANFTTKNLGFMV